MKKTTSAPPVRSAFLPGWGGMLAVALVMLFGMQLMRVLYPLFVQYLRDSVGLGSITLAGIALPLFALSLLAPLLPRLLGAPASSGRAALLVGSGVALARLAVQLAPWPAFDLVAAASGVVLFLWFLPLSIAAAGSLDAPNDGTALRRGMPLAAWLFGAALDTALHTGLDSLDLAWRTGWLPLLFTALLAGAVWGLTWMHIQHAPRSTANLPAGPSASAWPLLAVGSWLLLQQIVYQNVARLAAQSALPLPAAGLLALTGNLLALALTAYIAARAAAPTAHRLAQLTAAGVLLLSLVALNPDGPSQPGSSAWLQILLTPLGMAAAAMLLQAVLDHAAPLNRAPVGQADTRLARISLPHGLGAVLMVLLSFLYYASYDLNLGLRGSGFLLIAGVVLAAAGLFSTPPPQPAARPSPAFGLFLAGLLVLTLTQALGVLLAPRLSPAAADSPTLRVMTYNLHQGFDTRGVLDLEAIARVIEAEGADVVALQEVSRGWLTAGSADMLYLLSQRLNMPYVWGPTADPVWGNAVLSRYPIRSTRQFELPTADLRLRRGYTRVEIGVGSRSLLVYATHLHHIGADSDIRQLQAQTMLDSWRSDAQTAAAVILMGDLNSLPDSPEMRLLAAGGLVDLSAQLIPSPNQRLTFPSPHPEVQLDYIWASPNLQARDLTIAFSTASDHRPMAVTITLP